MDDLSALTDTVGPEVIAPVEGVAEATTAPTEATEGPTDGQAAPDADTAPEDEKPSQAKERREREKAFKARLAAERDAALAQVAEQEARRQKIIEAGKREKPPVESEFADPLEFMLAKTLWANEMKRVERDAGEAGEAANAARERAEEIKRHEQAITAQAWTAQVADAKTRYSDFAEVAMAQDVPISDTMAEIIQTSEVGADVAYFLGRHKALAADISKLTPVEAARAIGRIEAGLSAPRPRTETSAPPPISPVKERSRASADPARLSVEEYRKLRESGWGG